MVELSFCVWGHNAEWRATGTGNAYRMPILAALRAAGLHITSPDAYGKELYSMVARARVVLNLRSFGNGDEFKMSRLMVLFANSACVSSHPL